jgi:uncharacterized repeat protein (TIGR01451 family)
LLVTDSGGLTGTQSFTVTVIDYVDCPESQLIAELGVTGPTINLTENCRYVVASNHGGGHGHLFDLFNKQNVTLNGNGAIIERDTSAPEMGMFFIYTSTMTIQDVTIKDGYANGASWNSGGGIYAHSSNLTLKNVRFEANYSAGNGGGLYEYNSTVSLDNVDFVGNTSTGGGGGLYASSSDATLDNVDFVGNSATARGGGIAVYSNSSLTVDGATFNNNSAEYGGGLHENNSTVTLGNVNFVGNSVTARGGAIAMYDNSSLTVDGATFNNNSAEYGGGLHENNSTVTLGNVDFVGNNATARGGGIAVFSNSNLTVDGATFINNSAEYGGGVYVNSADETATMYNAVFADNTATDKGTALYSFGDLTVENSTFIANTQNQKVAIGVYGGDGVTPANLTIRNSIIANHEMGIAAGKAGNVTEDCNIFSDNVIDLKDWGGQITAGGSSKSVDNLLSRLADPANYNYRPIDSGLEVCATATTSSDADDLPRPYPGTLVDAGAYELQSIGVPSLSIVKTVPYWIVANDAELYHVTVSNDAPVDALNVVISDTLPAGVTYVNSSASDGGGLVNGAVRWDIGTLGAGQSRTVQYQAQASQTVTDDNYLAVSLADSTVSAIGPPVRLQVNTDLVAQDFLPNPDGFSFRNYDDIADSDLTADDMVSLFGADNVCKTQSPCVLTAAAEEWRITSLNVMTGGHCSGFAAGSTRIFSNPAVNPGDFQGGAGQTYDLAKSNMRNYIAYYFVTQSLTPVDPQGTQYSPTAATPVAVLDHLIATFNDPSPTDHYTLAIRKKNPDDSTSGHEVVPYAVKEITSNDVYWIYVYDNNFPDRFDLVVKIDRSENTWVYESAAINPSQSSTEWRGTAADQTILLKSLAYREQFPKTCTFCSSDAGGAALGTQDTSDSLRFIVDGEANLLVTRNDGKRVGYDPVAGQTVNEISGATLIQQDLGLGYTAAPIIEIPHVASATYSLQLFNTENGFGNSAASTNVTIVGPDVVVGVEGLIVRTPDEVDEADETDDVPPDIDGQDVSSTAENSLDMNELAFDPDPDNTKFGFKASLLENKQPTLKLAKTNPNGPDITARIGGVNLTKGTKVEVGLANNSKVTFSDNDTSQSQTYNLKVTQTDTNGQKSVYQKEDVTGGDGAGASVDFDGWDGQSDPPVEIVENAFPVHLPIIMKNDN